MAGDRVNAERGPSSEPRGTVRGRGQVAKARQTSAGRRRGKVAGGRGALREALDSGAAARRPMHSGRARHAEGSWPAAVGRRVPVAHTLYYPPSPLLPLTLVLAVKVSIHRLPRARRPVQRGTGADDI